MRGRAALIARRSARSERLGGIGHSVGANADGTNRSMAGRDEAWQALLHGIQLILVRFESENFEAFFRTNTLKLKILAKNYNGYIYIYVQNIPRKEISGELK